MKFSMKFNVFKPKNLLFRYLEKVECLDIIISRITMNLAFLSDFNYNLLQKWANGPKDHLMIRRTFAHGQLQPEGIADAMPPLRM